jgi:Fe-S-cluster-containing dehydrogenase component
MRGGMLINLIKCAGCYSCAIKCKQEHFLPPGIMWGRLLVSEQKGKYPSVKRSLYPVLCNHCQDPACVKVCPTGATQQRKDGIVWIDHDKCMGCRYCMVACPYQVRSYLPEDQKEYFPNQGLTEWEKMGRKLYPHQSGVVTKCNFCMERIDQGIKKGLTPGKDREATPACVITCPNKARYFGDLDDPESEISLLIREKKASPLHQEQGTEPCVYYVIG